MRQAWRARTIGLNFLVLSLVILAQSSIIPSAKAQPARANSVFATLYPERTGVIHDPENLGASTTANITAPSAPRNLNATPGNGQVTLNWNPPTSNGGAPIYYYLIQTYPKTYGNGSFNSVYGNTTYTDTTVINGQTYVFNVSATNTAYKTGPNATVLSTPKGIPTPPSAPQYPYAYATNAQVQLYWGTPTHWGGAPITNYTVYRGTSPGGETPLITVNATTHNYRDVNVTNGVTYYYEFAAINKAGTGPRTPELSVTPGNPPGPPTVPRNLTATAGDSRVTLQWQAPASNGGAVVFVYYIYRSTVSGQETYFNGSYSYVTNFTDNGLINGQIYYYQVEAANGYGYSPRTNEVSIIPVAPHPPSAPRNLTSIAGNGTVTLNWNLPIDSGGHRVSSYRVFRTIHGTNVGSYFDINLGTTFTDTGLANGQTYYYSVGAINSLGLGILANITATPIAPTVPIILPSTTPIGVTLMTNATISNFNYDQTVRSFTFTVTGGATGSIGVANITLPKSLVGSNTIITIYIDGKPISHAQLFFDANNYYVYFTFHFSTHTVNVTMGALATASNGAALTIDLILIGTLIAGIAVGAVVATLLSRRRKPALSIPTAKNV